MRIVDKYFESYLDGTISDQELKDFQDLLEDDPSLKTELAEVLEMRSQIHDDLLRLSPSEEYAGFVRSEVGALFEALGSNVDDDDEDRAGGFFLSGRTVRSAAAGVIAIVLVALAPTLLGPGSDVDPLSGPAITGTIESQVGQSGNQISTIDADDRDGLREVTSSSVASSEAPAGADEPRDVGTASSFPGVNTSVARDNNANSVESRQVALDLTVEDSPVSSSIASTDSEGALLSNDLTRNNTFLAFGSKETPNLTDAIGSGRDYADVARTASMFDDGAHDIATTVAESTSNSKSNKVSNPIQLSDDDDRQRIMFGGSLASGLSSKTANVSLEGSAYMALGLTESSRIGLEGGSATFRYKKRVSYRTYDDADAGHFGKSNTDHESPFGDFSIRGTGDKNGSNGDAVGGGRDNGNGHYETLDGGNIVDEKMPNAGPRTSGSGGTVYASQPGATPRYTYESLESEASMVYGLVFYDQKVASVNDRLNVHGRLGVGGTDGGVVLSAKAYAAISTHPNVAWTLGVGGSMLKDFANDIDFNATYGVNAGVEFGF